MNCNLSFLGAGLLMMGLFSCSNENLHDNSCEDKEISLSENIKSKLSEINTNLESDLNYTYLQFDLFHMRLNVGLMEMSDTVYFNSASQLREDSDSIQEFVYSEIKSTNSDFVEVESRVHSYQKSIGLILSFLDNEMEFETDARKDMNEKFNALNFKELAQLKSHELLIENEVIRNKLLSIEQVCAQMILIQLGKP